MKCCYQPDCTHPVCQSGHPSSTVCWYPGGYPVSYLPLPVPDSERPWGSQTCSTCKGFCAGHYSKYVDTNDPAALKSIKPPSVVLKQKFSELVNKLVTEDDARSVLLSVEDMKIWIDHLATVVQNRKRAWLRQQSAQQQSDHVEREGSEECYCGTCGKDYSTSPNEFWIGCDLCDAWYCYYCEDLTTEPTSETYFSKKCCN